MKLKHLLLLLCLSVTGIGQMRAADVITSGTSYYIQNVQSGLFLCGANNWGTRASVSVQGQLFTVTESGGVYTLMNRSISTSIAEANRKLGYNLFTDADPNKNGNTWTIAPVDGKPGVFTIYGHGKAESVENAFDGYLSQSNTAGAHIGYLAEGVNPATNASEWRFLTEQEAKAQLFSATASSGIPASFLIENANFSRNHNASTLSKNNEGVVTITNSGPWKIAEGCTNANLAGGGNDNHCAESYHSPFDVYQELSGIPNGVYKLTAQGFWRQDGSDNDNIPYFYANNEKRNMLQLTTNIKQEAGDQNRDGMDDASVVFARCEYTIEEITCTVTDGTLRIGVKNESNANLWCIWDNFNLTYYGFEDDTNVTSCIVNPSFESCTTGATDEIEGWENNSAQGMWTIMNRTNQGDPRVGDFWVEKYGKSGKIDLSQTISNLPKGLYRVSVLALDQASKTKLIAKTNAATMETPIVGGTATRYTVDIMLDGQSDLTIGLYCENHNTNSWVGFDDFHLTYVSSSYPELTAVVGKMNADVATAQTSALNQYNTEKTVANYKDAVDAIAAAQASKEHYEAAAIALPNQKALIDGTNVYAAGWLTGYVANYNSLKEKYDNNTLNEEEVVNPNAFTGWHASTAYNDLLTPWTFGGEACNKFDKALDINTWSQEGDTDGSNFQVPFFEYWVADEKTLQNKNLAATLTGLENGLYSVTAWVRVRATDDVPATDATGITLSVNGGTPVDATEGAQVGTSQLTLAEVTAEGPVSNGTLNIAFDINETNISWLAFKNVKYTKVRDLNAEEQAEVDYNDALASANNVKTTWAESPLDGVFQHTSAAYNALSEAITAAETAAPSDQEGWTAQTAALNAAVSTFNASKVLPEASKFYTMKINDLYMNLTDGANMNMTLTSDFYSIQFEASGANYRIKDKDGNYIAANSSNNQWLTAATANRSDFVVESHTDGTITFKCAYSTYSNWGWYLGAVSDTEGSRVAPYIDKNTNIAYRNWSVEPVESCTRATASGRYGTLCLPYDFNAEGADLYVVSSIEGNSIVLANPLSATEGVAGKPYLYCATADAQTFTQKSVTIATPVDDEYLVGSFVAAPVETGNYVLQTQNGVQGFYKVSAETPITGGAFKCYLKGEKVDNGRSAIFFDGDETAIDALNALTSGKAEIFDLNGRRLERLQKGINIVNGTKILVK